MASEEFDAVEEFENEEEGDGDLELEELDELPLDDFEEDDDLADDEEDDEDEDVEDEDEDVEDEEAGDEAVEDEEEESLDVLLSRDVATDDDDLIRLDDEPRDGLLALSDPPGAGEFTCRSCFLVKKRAQLADEATLVCLDCA